MKYIKRKVLIEAWKFSPKEVPPPWIESIIIDTHGDSINIVVNGRSKNVEEGEYITKDSKGNIEVLDEYQFCEKYEEYKE